MSDESHESEDSSFASTQDESEESSDNDNDPMEDFFGDVALASIFASDRFKEEIVRRYQTKLTSEEARSRKKRGLKQGLTVLDEFEINNVVTKLSSTFLNEGQLVQHLFLEICFHLPSNINQDTLLQEIARAVTYDLFLHSSFETAFLNSPFLKDIQPYVLVAKPFGQFVELLLDTYTDFRAIPTISLSQITPRTIEKAAKELGVVFHVSSSSLSKVLSVLENSVRHLESLIQVIDEVERSKAIDASLQDMDLFSRLKADAQGLIRNVRTLLSGANPFVEAASTDFLVTDYISKESYAKAISILIYTIQLEQKIESVTSDYETFLMADSLSFGAGGGSSLMNQAFSDRQDIAISDALKRAQRDIYDEVENILKYNIRVFNALKFIFFAIEKFSKGVSAATVATEVSIYSSTMLDFIGTFLFATDVPTIFSDGYSPGLGTNFNKHPLLPKDEDTSYKRDRLSFSFDMIVYRIQQSAISFLITKLHNICFLHKLTKPLIVSESASLLSVNEDQCLQLNLLDNTVFKDATIEEIILSTIRTFEKLDVHLLKVTDLYKCCSDYISHITVSRLDEGGNKPQIGILASPTIKAELQKIAELHNNFQPQIQQNVQVDFSTMDVPLTNIEELIPYVGLLQYRAAYERTRLTNFIISVIMAPYTLGGHAFPITDVSKSLLYEVMDTTNTNFQSLRPNNSSVLDKFAYDILLSFATTGYNIFGLSFILYYFGSISLDLFLADFISLRTDEMFTRFLIDSIHHWNKKVTFTTNLPIEEQISMIENENYVPAKLTECTGYSGNIALFRSRLIENLFISYANEMKGLSISKLYALYKRAIAMSPSNEFPHLNVLLTYKPLSSPQTYEPLSLTPRILQQDFWKHIQIYLRSYLETNPIVQYMLMLFLFKFGAISVVLPEHVKSTKEKRDHTDLAGFTDDPSSYRSVFPEASYAIHGDDIFMSVCYIHEAPLYLFSKHYAQGFNRVAFIFLQELYEQGKRIHFQEITANKVSPRIKFSLAKVRHPLVVSSQSIVPHAFSGLEKAASAFLFSCQMPGGDSAFFQGCSSFQQLIKMVGCKMNKQYADATENLECKIGDNVHGWHNACYAIFEEISKNILEQAQSNLIKVLHRQAIEALETQALNSLINRFATPEYNPLRLPKPTVSQTVRELREKPSSTFFHHENKAPFDTDPTREKSSSFVGACKNFRIMVCIPHRIVFAEATRQSADMKQSRNSANTFGNTSASGSDYTTFVVLDRYGRYLSHIMLSKYHEPLPNPLKLGSLYERVRTDFRSLVSSLNPISGSLVSCPREALFKVLDPALQVYTSRQTEFQRILDEAMLQDFIISSGVCAVGVLSRGFTSDLTYRNLEATLQYLNQPLPVYVEKSFIKKDNINSVDSQAAWKNVEFPCMEKSLISANPLFIDDLFFKRQPLAYNIARINLVRIPADVPMALYMKKQRILYDPSFMIRNSVQEDGGKLSFQKQMSSMVHLLHLMTKTATNIMLSSSPFYCHMNPVTQAYDCIYLCRRKLSLTISNSRLYTSTNKLALESLQLDENGILLQKNMLSQSFFKAPYLPGLFVPQKLDRSTIATSYHNDNIILGIWAGRYLLDPLAVYACLANGGGSMEDLVMAPLINFMTDFSPIANLDNTDKVYSMNISSDFYLRFKVNFSFVAHYALSLAVCRRRPDINLPFVSPYYTYMISFLPWLSPRKLLRLYGKISIYHRYDRFLAPSVELGRYVKEIQRAQEFQTYIQRFKGLLTAGSSFLTPFRNLVDEVLRTLENYLNNELHESIRQVYLVIMASTACNVHGDRFTFESLHKRRSIPDAELDIQTTRKANEPRRRGLVFKNKTFLANIIAELVIEDFVCAYCMATKQFQDTAFLHFTSSDDRPFTHNMAVQNIAIAAKDILSLVKSTCTSTDICNIQFVNPELYLYEQRVTNGSDTVYSMHFEGSVLIPDAPEKPSPIDSSNHLISLAYYNKLLTLFQRQNLMDFFMNPSYTPTNIMKRVCKHIELINHALMSSCTITHDVILSYPGGAYANAYTAEHPHIITMLLLRWVGARIRDLSFGRYRHPVDRTMLLHGSLELYYIKVFHSVSITAFSQDVHDSDAAYTDYGDGDGARGTKSGSETTFWPEKLSDYLSIVKPRELEGLTYHDMLAFSGEEVQLIVGLFLQFCLLKGNKKLDDFLHDVTLKTSLFQLDYCSKRNLSLFLSCLRSKVPIDSTDLNTIIAGIQETLHPQILYNYQKHFSTFNCLVLSEANNWPEKIRASIVNAVPLTAMKPRGTRLYFAKELFVYLLAQQQNDSVTLEDFNRASEDYKAISALCGNVERDTDDLGDEEPVENLISAVYSGFKATYTNGIGEDYTSYSYGSEGPVSVLQQELVKYLVDRFNRPTGRSCVDELHEGRRDFIGGFVFLAAQLLAIDPSLKEHMHSVENIRPILIRSVDSIIQAARYHQLRYPTIEIIDAGKPFIEYSKEVIFISLSTEYNPAAFARYRPFKVFCPLSQRVNSSVMKRVHVSRYEGLVGQVAIASDTAAIDAEDAVETEFEAYLCGIDLRQNILSLALTIQQRGDASDASDQRKVLDFLPQLHINKMQMRLLDAVLSTEQCYIYSKLCTSINNTYLSRVDKVPKDFLSFLVKPISPVEILVSLLKKLSNGGILDPGDTRQAQCTNFTRLSLYTLLSGSVDTIAGSLYRDLLTDALQRQLDWLFNQDIFQDVSELDHLFSNYSDYLTKNIDKIELFNPHLRSELLSVASHHSDISNPVSRAIQIFLDRLTLETYMPLVFLCREAHWNYAAYIPTLLFLSSQKYADYIRQQQQTSQNATVKRDIADPYFRNLSGIKICEYIDSQRSTESRPFIFVPHRDGTNKLRLVMCVPEARQTTKSLLYFTIQEDERYKPFLPNGQRNTLAISSKLMIKQLNLTDEAEKLLSFPNERSFDSLESIIRDFVRPINVLLRSIAQSTYFIKEETEDNESARERAKQMLHQSMKAAYYVFIEKLASHSYTVLFKLLPNGPLREIRLYIIVDGLIVRYRRSYFHVECRTWNEFIDWFNANAGLFR